MSINRKELKEIADLAKLNVTDVTLDSLNDSMNEIMDMIDAMNQVDVSGVAPMAHPMDAKQVLRADTVTDTNHQQDLLPLSSAADDEHYLVPKVIE